MGKLRKSDLQSVQIDVPLGRLNAQEEVYLGFREGDEASYVSDHLELKLRDRKRRAMLRRLLKGADAASARLSDGKHVDSNADVVRLILDLLLEADGGRGIGD